MIYQRNISREELFSSQLELLMQNARFATVGAHLPGIASAILLFWTFVELPNLLLWGASFTILLLVSALFMSNTLVERRFQSKPRRVYWQLLMYGAVTGAAWSSAFIYVASFAPATTQYVFLLIIVMITAFSVGVTVAIREYFMVYLFSSLWPIAWWCLVHYWEQSYNMLIGLFLLLICAVLMVVSDKVYRSYRNMISFNLQREAMARELGDLTGSLRDRNRQLRDARQQLTDLANIDELTGLGNRRLVNKVLQDEINRARRSGGYLSVILLDVDYFKLYNDTYGHPAGDVALQQLADLMQRASTRAGEVVARYGGEEFILIMPGASESVALRTAQRLRDMIEDEAIPHSGSEVESIITVSQGLVTVVPDGELKPEQLVKMADLALYEAKGSGRNKITIGADYGRAQEGPSLNL
jgi:diguanylate cyclase (GGDEF)-like protein